jgi:hypothetical protein
MWPYLETGHYGGIKIRSYWTRMGSQCNMSVFPYKKMTQMRHRIMKRTSHKDGGRGWRDQYINQGLPRSAGYHQQLEKQHLPSGLSEVANNDWHLALGLLAFSTVKQYISVVEDTKFVVLCYTSSRKLAIQLWSM